MRRRRTCRSPRRSAGSGPTVPTTRPNFWWPIRPSAACCPGAGRPRPGPRSGSTAATSSTPCSARLRCRPSASPCCSSSRTSTGPTRPRATCWVICSPGSPTNAWRSWPRSAVTTCTGVIRCGPRWPNGRGYRRSSACISTRWPPTTCARWCARCTPRRWPRPICAASSAAPTATPSSPRSWWPPRISTPTRNSCPGSWPISCSFVSTRCPTTLARSFGWPRSAGGWSPT